MNYWFWSRIGGRLWVYFLINISVKEYTWRWKYHHKLEMVCLYWILIFLHYCHCSWQCFTFIDFINGNLTALHILLSVYYPIPVWGMVQKVWFQASPNIFVISYDLMCFSSFSLMSTFDISVSFFGSPLFFASSCLFG